MTQPTRAQKTLLRIGIVRGNLAYLAQDDNRRLTTILNRFALQYRIAPNAMTRARILADSTPDDCALALLSNLDRITEDASFIRGINLVDSSVLNPHLHVLAEDCKAWVLAQDISAATDARIASALQRYLQCGLGSGSFAGSALEPVPSFLSAAVI